MITLVIDTHHLILEKGGTKRVTLNLLEQFYNDPHLNVVELKPSYLTKSPGLLSRLSVHFLRFFWVHLHLPLLCVIKKADILFSPEFNTPLFTTCLRVVIAHDAHIRAQKEYVSTLWFYLYYIPFIEAAIRRADLIFTISEFAKTEIVKLMRLNENRVRVAHNGIDPLFTAGNRSILPERLQKQFDGRDYILFVGTFEARKNIERLLKAFAIVKENYPVKIAVVGQPSTAKHSDRSKHIVELINKLCLQDDVIMCGYISDTKLPPLYRNAIMIAFPSLYEGFGLPILEGFASGVPVLTSNVCAMPEVADDAALLVDPYNVEDIADKMTLLLSDISLREQLILKGKERADKFTWKNCADIYLSDMLTLLKNRGDDSK